jgi:hypothetical protein
MSSILENFKPALFYRQKVYNVEQTFGRVLFAITNAYIAHKLNPIWGPYETRYNRALQEIHKTRADIYEIENEVDNATSKIDETINTYIKNINEQKEIETRLTNLIKGLEQDDPGAAGLRKGMTDTYKIQYVSNFFLVLGILLGIYILFYIFGKGLMSGENTPIAESIPVLGSSSG